MATPGTPEAIVAPTATIAERFPDTDALDVLHQVRSAIDSHTYEPQHQLRWPESQILREVLAISTIVWAHLSDLSSIESVLELSQWKTAICYVYLGFS